MSAKDHFRNEKVERLIKEVEESMQKKGLYLQQAGFMETPGQDEDGPVFLQATFLVGEQAFSERVQDPEQEEIDRQFEAMTKGFQEKPEDKIREQLEQSMRQGRSILDLDDE